MPERNTRWRLGIDLGTNSLGWVAVELDRQNAPTSLLAAGVRIFSDGRNPTSGTSLATNRRAARAARRQRDRFKQRQAALLKHLTRDGLFPADEAERKALAALDPYELRARALDESLPLFHIGRALFHLGQRRGFKSNRKVDRNDDESGKIAVGIDRLRAKMAEDGAVTYGEWLHKRRQSATSANTIPSIRARLRPEAGEDAKKDGYDFYPGRSLIEEEFHAIWEAQAPHHPEKLTDEVYTRLFEIVFHQRPLKPVKVGMCTFVHSEYRLPKAHPLFQRRRLLEELNALMILLPGEKAQRLKREDRDLLFLKLKDKKEVSFATLRKTLKLDPEARFNKESENRTKLAGDEVAAIMGAKTRFGTQWQHLTADAQWMVVERVKAVESDAEAAAFVDWLAGTYGIGPKEALAILNAPLPQGYGRFGLTATRRLIETLRDGTKDGRVLVYSEAVTEAGLGSHSDLRTGEIFTDAEGRPQLPYYGVALERHIVPGSGNPDESNIEARIGRLTNPTVHIGLNQLRLVVNRLIRAYGRPTEIALELARELKLTQDEKKQLDQENRKNRIDAERRGQKLLELGQRNTGANRALLKLWEELDENAIGRQCVYTGQVISPRMLFNGEAEIDHILPFRQTLDDSAANKIVCTREANRDKRDRSPFEAWGHTDRWEALAARAARLPRNKRWRFEPDAMERFREEEGFLARHLSDTQYLSRLAHEYLGTLYSESDEEGSHIWVSPGRLTEMVRRKLGLNSLLPDHNFGGGADQPKNRLDHRHHTIDAAVVAIIDRSMLNKIARASGVDGADGRESIVIPEPWTGFREELRRVVNDITVSHRPDHGTVSKAGLPKGTDKTAGRLHNDTAYGLATDAHGKSIAVHRVPLSKLKKPKDIHKIRDEGLKEALLSQVAGLEGKAFEQAVAAFPRREGHTYPGIRRVRLAETLAVIPIRDHRTGKPYKGYKGDKNYRYDVWELKDGKWASEVVSMFDAHQPEWQSAIRAAHPTARKVLSLHQEDMLAIERDGADRILARVVKFSGITLILAPPHEAGPLKERDSDRADPFKYISASPGRLKSWRSRQVRIDELGRVLDPGFPARTARRTTRKRS